MFNRTSLPLALLFITSSLACSSGGVDTPTEPGQQQAGLTAIPSKVFRNERSGCTLSVPDTWQVRARHFDENGPARKAKHTLTVLDGTNEAIRIDVWSNPEKTPLERWFYDTLGFLLEPQASLTRQTVPRYGCEGMLVSQPRSPQSFARTILVFSAGDRMVSVTCIDADNPTYLKAFHQVVDSFVVEHGS